jgi:hypothetical protein
MHNPRSLFCAVKLYMEHIEWRLPTRNLRVLERLELEWNVLPEAAALPERASATSATREAGEGVEA